jgi:hypothetical protein
MSSSEGLAGAGTAGEKRDPPGAVKAVPEETNHMCRQGRWLEFGVEQPWACCLAFFVRRASAETLSRLSQM